MAKQQTLHCSFCGRSRDEVKILIAGQEGHICENCVDHAQEIIGQEQTSAAIELGICHLVQHRCRIQNITRNEQRDIALIARLDLERFRQTMQTRRCGRALITSTKIDEPERKQHIPVIDLRSL